MSVKEGAPATGMLFTETKQDRPRMDPVARMDSRPVGLIAVSVTEVNCQSPGHRYSSWDSSLGRIVNAAGSTQGKPIISVHKCKFDESPDSY